MGEIFSLNKFNLIEDEENYYFFRGLEPGDKEDIAKGRGLEEGIRTDRERWEEEHVGVRPLYDKDSEISLAQMYSHIKIHYSLQTNCISLSSNANVALVYSDEYVMIKVPKREMGENVFHAGQYMLEEVERKINEILNNQEIDEEILEDIENIEKAENQKEIAEIIESRYTSKEPLRNKKAIMRADKTYRKPTARISKYQLLDEEQNLAKNKIIGKLTVLERKGILKNLVPFTANNENLIRTIGGAFSSVEQIYYGDIPGDRITKLTPDVTNMFGLLQQLEETEEVKEIKQELIKYITAGNSIEIPRIDDEVKKDITIEEMYELTKGKVEYGIASSIIKKMFYLSKAQLRARMLAEKLDEITGNNPRYKEVIENIKNKGFAVDNEIISRESGKGVQISESVNLDVRNNEKELVDKIKQLTNEELEAILEAGGVSNVRNIMTEVFGEEEKEISKEEYYASSIIDTYDWKASDIGEFTIEQRNEIMSKLQENNCMEIYKKLKELGVDVKEISTYVFNILTKNPELLKGEEYKEKFAENEDRLKEKLSIEQMEKFLGYYDVEGTGIILRDSQKGTVENIDAILEIYNFAVALLATGGGKSFIGMTELLKHKDEEMLLLAPQEEILEQWKDNIIDYIYGKQGTLGKLENEESKEELIKTIFPDITFETYTGLISKRGKEIIEKKYGFILLDELHRTGAEKWWKKLCKLLDFQEGRAKVLGLTATPERDREYIENEDGTGKKRRNMADEIALKLGYTEEKVKRGEHVACDIDLRKALKLGLVVSPKLVACKYLLKNDGIMRDLLTEIENKSDTDEE